jgi:hypothetical protein
MSKTKVTVPGAMPSVDDIMRYEQGEMTKDETIKFFQGLIDSGMAWRLQGCYGRGASALIKAGYCKAK